jgi:hypothetical protein
MRTNYKLFAPIAVAILSVFGVIGCGGGGSSTGPVTVSVTPSNPSVAVGQMQTFTANVVGGNGPATVTWTVKGAGTIDASSGVYTAPATVPATNDIVTATSQGATGSATVNVTASQALQVMPGGPAIPAGLSQTFTATAAGNPVGSITWQVNGLAGGDCVSPANNATTPCHGTIDLSGNYTAPLSPPPGGVTITALSGTDSGSTNPTVLYSAASLTSNGSTGQYGIQVSGSAIPINGAQGGPFNVVGSILTSGSPSSTSGTITGGEIDISSFDFGISGATAVTGGTYTIGATDGRTTMNITIGSNPTTIPSLTLQLALTTNQHGVLVEFDLLATASGTIDAQNTSTFSNSLSAGTNYSFSFSGLDANLLPMFGAGTFLAGGGGSIPVNSTTAPTNTQDLVDRNGFINTPTQVVTNDITLTGSYSQNIDQFGRGTIQMVSTPLGPINFAFYMIDQTHQNMVETDILATTPLLFGQMFSAPTNPTALTGGIAFTAGGSSGGSNYNPYVIGGVFPVNGTSIGSGGLLDVNTSSSTQVGTAISGGNYNNSLASGSVPGRYTLSLTTAKGTVEFAAYTTTMNTALLVQIDTNTDGSTGTAYQQSSPPATLGGGSFAVNLQGVGATKNNGSFEQDLSGQLGLSSTSTAPTGGTLDLNSQSSGPVRLAVNTTTTVINTPVPPTSNRGTAIIKTNNNASFALTYYLVSPTTSIFIDTDSNRVGAGVFLKQF